MVAPRADDAFGNVGSLIVGGYIFNGDLSSIAKDKILNPWMSRCRDVGISALGCGVRNKRK